MIGPEIPAHLRAQSKSTTQSLKEEDEEEGGPIPLPQSRKKAQTSGPSSSSLPSAARRPIGPVLPQTYQTYRDHAVNDDDEDEDDQVGPRPPSPSSGVQHDVDDDVRRFMEVEEKRRKKIEEASKPKPLKREEWMLKPPTSSELLGSLDPTRLKAPRQFSRTAGSSRGADSSLWTETPAEKQQRLADEVIGKRRRALDPIPEDDDKKKRKKDEEYIRKGVDEYTARVRGPSLLQQHTVASEKNKQEKDEKEVIWDHARDMGVGGRLMDDERRNKYISEARGLGDRFSSGKSGGFL